MTDIIKDKQEWENLIDYITIYVMDYPSKTPLTDAMISAIQKTLTYFKVHNEKFTCEHMIQILRDCRANIDYCNKTITYSSELYKLNTAMKVIKNRFYDEVDEKKKHLVEQRENIPVLPLFDNNASELEMLFFKKCDYDSDMQEKVKNSLIKAWCDGKIVIETIRTNE